MSKYAEIDNYPGSDLYAMAVINKKNLHNIKYTSFYYIFKYFKMKQLVKKVSKISISILIQQHLDNELFSLKTYH